jgi:hypothetical protein
MCKLINVISTVVFVESEMDSLGHEALEKLDLEELERLCRLHGLAKKIGDTRESIWNEREGTCTRTFEMFEI